LRNGTVTIDGPTAEAIIHTISDNEIGIASFDPLVAHHRTTENVTGDMDQVVREFARIASATDCSIEIVHHTRKPAPGQEELSVIDSRGAGAIIDAVRSARVLNTMSKTEADNAGIDDVDRRLHFRIDKGKANMAPPTAAKWHKFVGVELPNSDNVGVATPRDFPGQGASSPQMAEAERAAEHVFTSLLMRFTLEGRNVSHSAGTNYAPPLFVKEPEAKVAKLSKRALEDAMRRLFVAKRIKVEHRETRGGRKANALVMV
jgi:RecA-family ATPase